MDEAEKIRLVGLLNGKPAITGIEKHFLKVMEGKSRAITLQEKEWVEWALQYKRSKANKSADIHPVTVNKTDNTKVENANWRLKKAIEIADKQLNKKIRTKNPAQSAGWTSIQQGNQKIGDNAVKKKYVDEGIAGSREENKAMRRNQSKDMMKRNHGLD